MLLFILGFIAFSVFIATQDGGYTVQKSRIIPLSKTTLYQYVNNFKNWQDWGSWVDEDPKMKFIFSDISSGVGSQYEWEGKNEDGLIKNIFESENDSIVYSISTSTGKLNSFISFKEVKGGTLITWSSSGTLDFKGKCNSLLYGSKQNELETVYTKSLEKLEKVLTKEIATYNIEIEGVVQIDSLFYLQKKSDSKITDYYIKLGKLMPEILNFTVANKMPQKGKPFTIFDKYELNNNRMLFSVCIPLKEEIYTTAQSEYTAGKLESHSALKIILKGDYSHSKKAWEKGFNYIIKNKLEEVKDGIYREVYITSSLDSRKPSSYITEVYIPVKPTIIPKPRVDIPIIIQPKTSLTKEK